MKMYPLRCKHCTEVALYSKKDFHAHNDGPTSTYYEFYCKKCGKATGEWGLGGLINSRNVGWLENGKSIVIKVQIPYSIKWLNQVQKN